MYRDRCKQCKGKRHMHEQPDSQPKEHIYIVTELFNTFSLFVYKTNEFHRMVMQLFRKTGEKLRSRRAVDLFGRSGKNVAPHRWMKRDIDFF